MKLRFYLRGLGIGILMTVVILAISGVGNKTMSDEEVKARARKLGMVESKVLSDTVDATVETATSKPEETATSKPEETATPKPKETATPKPEETATPKPKVTATPKPEETSTPKPEVTATPKPETTSNPNDKTETVTIVISLGDSSVSVSKDLVEAGLVESASAYDKYLCDNGYDRKIRTGTYQIPVGASEEEIALIITRKK